jgi:hypothetical protein
MFLELTSGDISPREAPSEGAVVTAIRREIHRPSLFWYTDGNTRSMLVTCGKYDPFNIISYIRNNFIYYWKYFFTNFLDLSKNRQILLRNNRNLDTNFPDRREILEPAYPYWVVNNGTSGP